MGEGKSIYEVRVNCKASYNALVRADTASEAISAAEELAMGANPVEFEITEVIGSSIVERNPDNG